MKAIITRIQLRIDQMNEAGAKTSERAISKAATGSSDTIRNWRRGLGADKAAGATLTKLGQVAKALNVSPDWLLTGEGVVDGHNAALISEIIDLLPELDPAELKMLRAAARGYRDQHREGSK